jgi:tetratricopeptide (TPR) repeat protein
VGLVSLVVAVAERADLPIYPVAAPGHVFARWDDGENRINLECTAAGESHPDSWYMEGLDSWPITPKAVERGTYLRNLTRDELLAIVLSNRAALLSDLGRPIRAREANERALELYPGLPAALLRRCRYVKGDGLRELEAVLDRDPAHVPALILGATIHFRAGRREAALDWCKRALEVAPRNEDALAAWIDLHPDPGQAKAAAEEAVERRPGSYPLRLRRLVLLVRIRDPGWRREFEFTRCFAGANPGLWLALAEEFLREGSPEKPDPRAALGLLDELTILDRNPFRFEIEDCSDLEQPPTLLPVLWGEDDWHGWKDRRDQLRERAESMLR